MSKEKSFPVFPGNYIVVVSYYDKYGTLVTRRSIAVYLTRDFIRSEIDPFLGFRAFKVLISYQSPDDIPF